MRSYIRLAAALGLAGCILCVSGCIDSTTVISVKKDGSGTVTETVYLGESLSSMMAAFGGGAEGAGPELGMSADEKRCKERALTMGDGVRFVSTREVQSGPRKGTITEYAFRDVRALKANAEPNLPSADQPQNRKGGKPITFDFAPGLVSKLVVNIPRVEPDADAAPAPADAMSMIPPEQLEPLKAMFKGFRMRVQVQVDGAIEQTNASHVHAREGSNVNQVVTLFDVNIDEILEQEGSLAKLASLGSVRDMATAAEKLKDIPGLTFETENRVELNFK